MEIDEAVKAYLLTKSGLTDLISTRIYTDDIPPKMAFPLVVYMKISDIKDHELTGQLELERPVFQYTTYATTRASARAIANQIKTALVDYTGTMGGIEIQYIKMLNELSSKETSPDGTQKVYTEDQEYEINFTKE